MANVNGPVGLVPSRVLGGGCITSNPYSIASAYDTAIHVGDPVEMTGTSNNIGRAAAGTVNAIGVFAGCKFIDAEGRPQFKPYWPANQVATEIEALVWDDPNIIFRAQADTLAADDVGALAGALFWEVFGSIGLGVVVGWGLAAASLAAGVPGVSGEVHDDVPDCAAKLAQRVVVVSVRRDQRHPLDGRRATPRQAGDVPAGVPGGGRNGPPEKRRAAEKEQVHAPTMPPSPQLRPRVPPSAHPRCPKPHPTSRGRQALRPRALAGRTRCLDGLVRGCRSGDSYPTFASPCSRRPVRSADLGMVAALMAQLDSLLRDPPPPPPRPAGASPCRPWCCR